MDDMKTALTAAGVGVVQQSEPKVIPTLVVDDALKGDKPKGDAGKGAKGANGKGGKAKGGKKGKGKGKNVDPNHVKRAKVGERRKFENGKGGLFVAVLQRAGERFITYGIHTSKEGGTAEQGMPIKHDTQEAAEKRLNELEQLAVKAGWKLKPSKGKAREFKSAFSTMPKA